MIGKERKTMPNIFDECNFDQTDYEYLLGEALTEGKHIVHSFKPGCKGGITLVWQRTTDSPKCKMIKVSVSYCSDKDYFCRKIGAYNALSRFDVNQFVTIPIGHEDSAVIVARLRRTFNPDILDEI